MRTFRKLDAFHQGVLSIANSVGSAWIFVLMAIIVWDVLGRVLFNSPLQGTPELVSNSIIIITFLQIPFVMFKRQHVRSTMVYDRMPRLARDGIDILVAVVGIVLFFWLIQAGWEHFVVSVEIGEFEGEGALRVPTAPGRFALLFGSTLMILEFALSILRILLARLAIREGEDRS